ncbi:lipid-A-disaccharide synthase N-terminal domain-containing protein [Jiella sonneratiae]|uniref:Lipid-A-disaccharide synthase N-terminal domain-containing protein n=1 Tax=Jiella sonneratiae TaxID=2816856 RepID=A0ABS3J1U2_9HYPH|nr:lipid-A-disaccharide synthase N-terminal domain-containing protein [Jiella sonneratiae]MBO0903643.1 lipid-A-disaccharide synthase N-terminal domain-containing protein [Jiella sonneratiae]
MLSYLNHVFIEQFDLWIVLGFIAQAMFTARFLIQWIASERARRSVMPVAFWTFSLLGGSLLLVYALHRRDPVFIIGQAAGLFIYARNVMLIVGEKKRTLAETESMEIPHS